MHSIPEPIKKILRPPYKVSKAIFYKTLDIYDILKGSKHPLVPPRNMIFIGDGDYLKTGEEFLKYFKDLGNLKPNHKILDVGCGIGRMSVPLTYYVSDNGEYFGFDIVKKGIDWCKKNISVKYPNFHYEHSDIYNKMYNPTGKENSLEYKFKYEDNFFDFVFLTSVFTHMQIKEVSNYLKEISRVLKPGGKCLITFFLINKESLTQIKNVKSSQNLKFQIDEFSFTKDKNFPEGAIGFNEEFIKDLFKQNNLIIEKPIHYGSWCGRRDYLSYQDIIIAHKI